MFNVLRFFTKYFSSVRERLRQRGAVEMCTMHQFNPPLFQTTPPFCQHSLQWWPTLRHEIITFCQIWSSFQQVIICNADKHYMQHNLIVVHVSMYVCLITTWNRSPTVGLPSRRNKLKTSHRCCSLLRHFGIQQGKH